jgi:hypothetical protein
MPSQRQDGADWEHLSFLTAILAFLVWYLWDATAASPTFSNLILIAPVGALAIALCCYVASAELIGRRAAAQADASGDRGPAASSRFRTTPLGTIALLMSLFALFVAAIPYLGFDIATFFFMIATLRLLGERNPFFALALALGISAGVSIAALALLTVPMPMGIAQTVWRAL